MVMLCRRRTLIIVGYGRQYQLSIADCGLAEEENAPLAARREFRQTRPIRRLAKNRTPKNAVDAATCPDGNAWYFVLKRFQTSSALTDGRARPVAVLIPWPSTPAIDSAINIDKKMRVHFLFPRHHAKPASASPSAKCSGQSPNRLTLRMKLCVARF